MTIDLRTQADAVCDEPSLILFIEALAKDREEEVSKETISPSSPYGPGSNGWENRTIEAFLNASTQWAEASSKGLPSYEVPNNPWQRCAHILLMGKLYE